MRANGWKTSTKSELNAKWRKLHLGLDLASGMIICSDLTTDDVGDPTALPGLLDQVDDPVDTFIADGAYDGAPTHNLLVARFGAKVNIVIPPPKTAVSSPQAALNPSVRNRHIAQIKTKGRTAWQQSSGYNRRSRGETQMDRWKTVIGQKLKRGISITRKQRQRSASVFSTG